MLSEREHTCLGDGTAFLCKQAMALQTGNCELSLCSQLGRHFQLLRFKKTCVLITLILMMHACMIFVVTL